MERIKLLVDAGCQVKMRKGNGRFVGEVRKQGDTLVFDGSSLEELVDEMQFASEIFRHNEQPIQVARFKGTWHVIGIYVLNGREVLQLEHSSLGEDTCGLFVTEDYKLIFVDEGNNGFDEFNNYLDNEECPECGKTLRELFEGGIEFEYINGVELMCMPCQVALTE